MTNELKDILQAVEPARSGDASGVVSDAFVTGVYEKLAQRRQRARRVSAVVSVGCVGVLLLGGVVVFRVNESKDHKPGYQLVQSDRGSVSGQDFTHALDAPTPDEVERELAAITRTASAINERLRLLAQAETRVKRQRRIDAVEERVVRQTSVLNPKLQAALAAETAAQSMLQRGALLEKTDITAPQARAAYERVIEVFPQTEAADRARQRLLGVQES